MKTGSDGLRLRVFIHEGLRHQHKPLYAAIVEQARHQAMAGATVFRGAWLQPWGVSLPVPVLLANVLGAFLLGVVSVLADEAGLLWAETRLFLAVGVLGGFTTFSTLGWGADLLLVQGARRGAGLIGRAVARPAHHLCLTAVRGSRCGLTQAALDLRHVPAAADDLGRHPAR